MKSGRVHSLDNLMLGSWSAYPTLSSRSKSSTVVEATVQGLGVEDAPIIFLSIFGLFYSGNTSSRFGLAVAPINHADPNYLKVGVRLGNVKNCVNMNTSFDQFPFMGVADRVPRIPLPLNLFSQRRKQPKNRMVYSESEMEGTNTCSRQPLKR